jgi:protein MAK11
MERQSVVSFGGYEGGLNGISFGSTNKGTLDLSKSELLKDLKTEYSFTASESSLNCADGCQNLLALGGFEEVIRLFDVHKKKDLGDLVGEHEGTITAL